jgi:ribosome-associated toxin RatA of RatAB toxin-antitoxin module
MSVTIGRLALTGNEQERAATHYDPVRRTFFGIGATHHSMARIVARTRRWNALVLVTALVWGLACGVRAHAGDMTLSEADQQRVAARQIVIRAALDKAQRRGTVRAAVRIDATPDVVFQQMTRCEDALQYVPHLKLCKLRDRAPDNSWLLIEHEIDFGWYAPRIHYVFHADLVTDRSIEFHQVSGDFKANEGRWELQPADDGTHTVILYRATIDPPGYMPNWLVRSTFRREMPQMLADLRRRCEAEQSLRAAAKAP